MTDLLRTYLAENKSAIDQAVSGIVQSIQCEEDTPRDRKRYARDAFLALKAALAEVLENGPDGGRSSAVVGQIALTIHRPRLGEELFDRIRFDVGFLGGSGMVPRPKDWPKPAMELPAAAADLMDKLFRAPPCEPQYVVVESDGKVDVGRHLDGRQFLIDQLPGGEIWLHPMEQSKVSETAP